MLTPLTPADAKTFREFLRAAGYTPAEIQRQYGMREVRPLPAEALPDGLQEPTVLNLLLRWFSLGLEEETRSAEPRIPAPILSILKESGMLHQTGTQLMPAVMLTPADDILVASDGAARLHAHTADIVVWPNPTTRALHQFTIRRPVESTLDLGAGCGVQALYASSHSRSVTATDLNPRAAAFTAFNAWLNGAANIECLTGDTFDPLPGRTFDLIVANLPFFVTPSGHLMYCENSLDLDGYAQKVVTQAPGHLNEGGFAQVLLEWVQVRGQRWEDRLRQWIAGAGCDAWLFRNYTRPAEDYARDRIGQTVSGGIDPKVLQAWMDHYRRHGVEAIHGGMLALRRRAGENWVRFEDMPSPPGEPFGEAVWTAFACADFLEAHRSDADLLAARPRLAADAQFDQHLRQVQGRWKPVGGTLRLTRGIPASMGMQPPVADFLSGLDGRQTLAERIAAFAKQVRADPAAVRQECLAVVRKLIDRRFLTP